MPRGIPRWLEAGTSSHFSYAATPPRISIQSTSTLTAVMDIYADEGIPRTYRIGNFRPVLRECLRTAMGGCVPRGEPKKLAPGWVGDYHVAAPIRSPAMPSSPISPCPSCPPHPVGGHGCAVYSSSVTDAQWAILEPLLPAPGSTAGRGGRPEKHCRRAIVDAILGIAGGGIPWRQLPVQFPPAGMSAVFARRARGGAWQCILDALRDRPRVRAGRDRCPTAAIIDSQTVPAADTMPRSSRGWDGGTRTNGVKRHIAVDVNGLLLAVVVSAASIQDRDAAHRLLAALRGSFSTIGLVWADGGYPGRLLIWAKDVLTLTMQIIKRIPGATGFHVRPRIWVVERSFAWINKHRRCVPDYETRPDRHEAMVHLAMITTMTRRLART